MTKVKLAKGSNVLKFENMDGDELDPEDDLGDAMGSADDGWVSVTMK